jgi:tRNA(adenine34) deaminase
MISQVSRLPPLSGNSMQWMERAIALAEQAAALDEVPVGAVLVLDNQVIGEGYNSPILHSDPSAHAEIMALRAGAKKIGNYRILDATLYVTLEPCMMCAGAMVHARIKSLVFGAYDAKAGAIISQYQALDAPFLNHKVSYSGGVMAEQCGSLLSRFFRGKR